MSDLDDFRQHRATVQTYLGVTGSGTVKYAAPVTVEGFWSQRRHLVRDANAEQVLSSSSFTALDGTAADVFAPKSLIARTEVKQPDGTWLAVADPRTTTVVTVAESSGGDLITGLDRVKVWLA